jgi:hypothetical protein
MSDIYLTISEVCSRNAMYLCIQTKENYMKIILDTISGKRDTTIPH